MKDLQRLRPLAGLFTYKLPSDAEFKNLSQQGLSNHKLVHFDGEPITDFPLWPQMPEDQRTLLREALREMSFNKARLISRTLASVMIALDPLATLDKAIAEGFWIAGQGGSKVTPTFSDYLSLAQEYACYVGPKNVLEFAAIYDTLPFKLSVVLQNSKGDFVAKYLKSTLSSTSAPLRLRISSGKEREDVYRAIESMKGTEAMISRIHACDALDPLQSKNDGWFFDPHQCPDLTELSEDCPHSEDFNWRSRLNLCLVDQDEQAEYLLKTMALLPGIKNGRALLQVALGQEPGAFAAALPTLSHDQGTTLLEFIPSSMLGRLPASVRDHKFGSDLGL
ncbi:hypothetical protein IFT48_01615 [Pseudomonas fluorescens]|uniref:hypothetical protein n=1 Tax=Pseudomonas TaxID=286 RepID=UPI000F02E2D8|nr:MULTISPECIES: hypothetical protein [Pseudomonas]MBD8088659.1 hypothetical protein [Pseudomonas fluorescens]MBD8614880.1 hypothetical protein [Pseudomonas putida]MBD8681436.1 hypothetical protein [Pseudomonas sp. CFBP 13719]